MSGGEASTTAPPRVTDQSYRDCLKVGVAAVLVEAGFDGATDVALESLTEVMQSFLAELGRSTRAYTELACRNNPLPADILLALVEMGRPPAGLREYAFRAGRKCLGTPAVAVQPKTASILHTGDRKRHRPGGIVPENFAEFPDSHSYVRTPTHKQPVTDYQAVREKAASQKRDVERALTRFIAKTGKTHSLFGPDEPNLFPLVSCDRGPLAGEAKLPAYTHALLFRDQLFDEEKSDYARAKKRKEEEERKAREEKAKKKKKKSKKQLMEEEEEKKEEDEAAAAAAAAGGDDDEANAVKVDSDDEEHTKEVKKEETVAENPFIKDPRMHIPSIGKLKRNL